jgi:hypothetical protein
MEDAYHGRTTGHEDCLTNEDVSRRATARAHSRSMARSIAALLVVVAACAPNVYVAGMYELDGKLYQQKCYGTANCTAEEVGPMPTAPAPAADPANAPPELERDMVARTLDQVKPTVGRCGNTRERKQFVAVWVKVAPDGEVDHVIVRETDDAALAECVALAMRTAHFPRTQHGGEFRYPFVI